MVFFKEQGMGILSHISVSAIFRWACSSVVRLPVSKPPIQRSKSGCCTIKIPLLTKPVFRVFLRSENCDIPLNKKHVRLFRTGRFLFCISSVCFGRSWKHATKLVRGWGCSLDNLVPNYDLPHHRQRKPHRQFHYPSMGNVSFLLLSISATTYSCSKRWHTSWINLRRLPLLHVWLHRQSLVLLWVCSTKDEQQHHPLTLSVDVGLFTWRPFHLKENSH